MIEHKVLDHGFVRLVDTMGNDERVVQAARISYGREDTENAAGLINYLMRKGHTSVFEQPHITLHIKLPIFVLRQWGRHRTFKYVSMNEISGRYTEFKDEFYVPEEYKYQSKSNKQGSGEVHPLTEDLVKETVEDNKTTYENYTGLLEHGVAKEQARISLPFSLYTQIYMTVDLHNLLHFLKLRTDNTAQWEIREYARVIEEIVAEWVPVTYAAWVNYVRDSVTFSAKAMEAINCILNDASFECSFDLRDAIKRKLSELGVSTGEMREILDELGE